MNQTKIAIIFQTLVVILYVALITFSPSIHFIEYVEFHDCQRVIQLLLLSFVLIDAAFAYFNKPTLIPISNKVRYGSIALCALLITSSARSIEPRYALIEITIFTSLCYLALFVARFYCLNSDRFTKQITYALLASIILYMVSFYTGYLTAMVARKPLVWPYPFYGFSNIRLFQQYQLWTLGIICLPLLAFDINKHLRVWLYVALTLWWVLLFYAASRGAILAWLFAMLATLVVFRKIASLFLRIQLISAVSGVIAYTLLFKFIPNLETSSTIVTSTIFRDTVSDRIDLWNAAFAMIKDSPLLGVGPMHFYHHNLFGTHPHNSLLQLASEWGVPATLIVSAMSGYSFCLWMKKFNALRLQSATKLNSQLAVILFFTITASAAYSLVDGVIVMPISQVLMFTIVGLMIGQYTEKNLVATNIKLTDKKLRFHPLFACIVLLSLVLSTMPELARGLTSADIVFAYSERAFSVGPGINPRIWMQQRRKN